MQAMFGATVLAALTLLASSPVYPHAGEDEHDEGKALLDCRNLPAKALKALPPPMNDWAQLECVPAGQVLVQGQQWTWRYPASFTTPVHIPAWSAEPATAATDALYFTAADVSVVRGDAAKALEAKLASDVEVYAALSTGKPAVRDIYTVTTRNSAGHQFEIHFLYRSDQDIWGLVCAPDCRSDFSFILNSKRN